MSDGDKPQQESIDLMVAALDRQRRIGWAKAYDAQEKLGQTAIALDEATKGLGSATEEIKRLQQRLDESDKLHHYVGSLIDVLAPGLSPWLRGADPGLETFDGRVLCTSDDTDELRQVATQEAQIWLDMNDHTRERLNWRARQLHDWYRDEAWYNGGSAPTPKCGNCKCASWEHQGPDGPCVACADCGQFLLMESAH